MVIPEGLLSVITQLGFVFEETNQYTLKPRYCRKVRNISVNNSDYYNPAILLETTAENYIVFKIVGYRKIDDRVVDISRMLYPGVGQLLYYGRLTGARRHLQWYRQDAISKYAS